jgi:succinate dehydrogenase / fumarate reductase, membrane anchor subunit
MERAAMTTYRTPLKDVRGLGSAKGGTGHFWAQRVTAISNILVIAFLVYAALSLAGAPRSEVKAFFQEPLAGIFGVLLAISVTVHMRLGMQVIVEDYVHGAWKLPLLLLNTFFSIFIGVATILAVAKLYLGV